MFLAEFHAILLSNGAAHSSTLQSHFTNVGRGGWLHYGGLHGRRDLVVRVLHEGLVRRPVGDTSGSTDIRTFSMYFEGF